MRKPNRFVTARGGTEVGVPVRPLPGASGWRDERRRPKSTPRPWWRRPAPPSRDAAGASASPRVWAGAPQRASATRHHYERQPSPIPTPQAHGWRSARAPRRARSNPAFRRLRRTVSLLAVLTLAVAAALAWTLTSPTWQVRHLRVEGTGDPALLTAIHALPLTGCNAFRCDLAGDAALVERIPAVAHTNVWVVWPDTLAVRVVARSPALIWRVADQPYLVAADGVLLGLATTADMARLALVDDRGGSALGGATALPGARLPAALVGVAAQLLSALPEVLGRDVTLRYTTGTGLVAADGQGLEVAFGDPTRPPSDTPQGVGGQMAELRALLGLLQRQGQRADWIDLRWGWHPIYRLAGT